MQILNIIYKSPIFQPYFVVFCKNHRSVISDKTLHSSEYEQLLFKKSMSAVYETQNSVQLESWNNMWVWYITQTWCGQTYKNHNREGFLLCAGWSHALLTEINMIVQIRRQERAITTSQYERKRSREPFTQSRSLNSILNLPTSRFIMYANIGQRSADGWLCLFSSHMTQWVALASQHSVSETCFLPFPLLNVHADQACPIHTFSDYWWYTGTLTWVKST